MDLDALARDGALFERRFRSSIVFADHSLATDSVFSEVHLVSCRNVLIYFDRPSQEAVFGRFHDALAPGGEFHLQRREWDKALEQYQALLAFEPGNVVVRTKIGIVQLQKMTGAEFAQVSFTQGTAPSLVALLGGKIDVHCGHAADVLGQVGRHRRASLQAHRPA